MQRPQPPPRLSRAEAKQRTRQRLLAAAASVVARRGSAEASVDEIAETAGHTVGALYSHFGSKTALIVEALHAYVMTQVARARSITETGSIDGEDGRPVLGELLARLAGGEGATGPLLWSELWLRAARSQETDGLVAHARAVDHAIATTIRHRRTAGPPATDSSATVGEVSDEALATVVSSLFRGLAQRRVIDPEAVPDPLLGQAMALLVAGRRALAADRARTGRAVDVGSLRLDER